MAWCRQATSHYLNQCWPRSPMPYGITRPEWVNSSPHGQNGCRFIQHWVSYCPYHLLWIMWKLFQKVVCNKHVSQFPQCIGHISHNALFCNRNVHVCAHFCYEMVHYGICRIGLLDIRIFVHMVCAVSEHDDFYHGAICSGLYIYIYIRYKLCIWHVLCIINSYIIISES